MFTACLDSVSVIGTSSKCADTIKLSIRLGGVVWPEWVDYCGSDLEFRIGDVQCLGYVDRPRLWTKKGLDRVYLRRDAMSLPPKSPCSFVRQGQDSIDQVHFQLVQGTHVSTAISKLKETNFRSER